MKSFTDTELLLGAVLFLAAVTLASLPETAFFLGRVLSDALWLLRQIW
jgi:hypothetical protein